MNEPISTVRSELADVFDKLNAGIIKPEEAIQLAEFIIKMHHGLMNMQARLDDHEKVLEKIIRAMDNLAMTAVPAGFRKPPKGH